MIEPVISNFNHLQVDFHVNKLMASLLDSVFYCSFIDIMTKGADAE